MSVMEQVKGVRLFVVPVDLMKTTKVHTPAVMVDDKIISQDGGPGNGRVSEDIMLKVLQEHGAVVIDDDREN